MANEIKVISLWQPWASLVAWNLKEYETRHWRAKSRGLLAIASTKTQPVCLSAQLDKIWNESGKDKRLEAFIEARDLPQGVITSVCHGFSCYGMSQEIPGTESQIRVFRDREWKALIPAMTPLEIACGDWKEGRYAWKLIGVKRTTPIPHKGSQGLGTIGDPEVCRILREVLFGEAIA